jgi:hypothetical protein
VVRECYSCVQSRVADPKPTKHRGYTSSALQSNCPLKEAYYHISTPMPLFVAVVRAIPGAEFCIGELLYNGI